MEAGWSRINGQYGFAFDDSSFKRRIFREDLIIIQTSQVRWICTKYYRFVKRFSSQGLAEYVSVHVREAHNRGLVVGHDHRHHSEHWARLTAQVFIAQGFRVYLLHGNVHTPL